MTNFLKRILNFIRTYPGILYSFLLIIIIPLALYYNTFYTTRAFQKNVDFNLQTKALTIENILGLLASDFFSQPELLQQKIGEIVKENPEIKELRIIKEESGDFKVISSQNLQEMGGIISDPSLALSWFQNQTIANLISEKGERFWKVTKPIYKKETGEKIGLISMALSLGEADLLITRSIYRSYLIVIISILLCLFLIIHHTRLFGYVSLTKRLQEIDKMKDEFIRMATHELQSPLVNIRGYLLALKEEMEPFLNEEQKKFFSRVEISAKNLSDLIEDILEVSRIEQGRLDFTPIKVFPSPVTKEIIEEFKLKAEQKNLKLIFEEKESPYFIQVNLNRFKQILTNLINNALKYTKKGEIETGTEIQAAKRKYIIFVRDTGLGISAEAQKRLFEKFYRVKTKETAEIPGTGLGLWIVKQLCEKMGGKIFVESMEGVGTKFILIFPLYS